LELCAFLVGAKNACEGIFDNYFGGAWLMRGCLKYLLTLGCAKDPSLYGRYMLTKFKHLKILAICGVPGALPCGGFEWGLRAGVRGRLHGGTVAGTLM
jgi:hypothetical protein